MLFHCLPYEEQVRRLHDAQEICHVLRDMFDPEKLRIEYTEDGHPLTDAEGRQYHAIVTVLATGDRFPLFVQHDESEDEHDFMVRREWFCGSIRWIPLHLDMDIRDSFMAEYHRWADLQWQRCLARRNAKQPRQLVVLDRRAA